MIFTLIEVYRDKIERLLKFPDNIDIGDDLEESLLATEWLEKVVECQLVKEEENDYKSEDW